VYLESVTRLRRLLLRVLSGVADRDVRFVDLCILVRALGFEERVRGSHHIFARPGVAEIINLQPMDGGKAKPYQVKQVRAIVLRYQLSAEID